MFKDNNHHHPIGNKMVLDKISTSIYKKSHKYE